MVVIANLFCFICKLSSDVGWKIVNYLNYMCSSSSSSLLKSELTLLLRQITGHREHPSVQQQHMQPQNNHLTLTGSVFLSTLLIRATVAWYSSGATRDCSPDGNSPLKRLLRPKLKQHNIKFIYI